MKATWCLWLASGMVMNALAPLAFGQTTGGADVRTVPESVLSRGTLGVTPSELSAALCTYSDPNARENWLHRELRELHNIVASVERDSDTLLRMFLSDSELRRSALAIYRLRAEVASGIPSGAENLSPSEIRALIGSRHFELMHEEANFTRLASSALGPDTRVTLDRSDRVCVAPRVPPAADRAYYLDHLALGMLLNNGMGICRDLVGRHPGRWWNSTPAISTLWLRTDDSRDADSGLNQDRPRTRVEAIREVLPGYARMTNSLRSAAGWPPGTHGHTLEYESMEDFLTDVSRRLPRSACGPSSYEEFTARNARTPDGFAAQLEAISRDDSVSTRTGPRPPTTPEEEAVDPSPGPSAGRAGRL